MTSDQIADYFLLIIPLGMLGARLYYVVFQRDTAGCSLKNIFDTRSGGLAFYGGVIGGILAIIIMAKFKKHKLSRIFDFFVVYLPLGQAIGRWGNFFNQEAFGVNTNLPWGMYSNGTEAYIRSLSGVERSLLPTLNPSQPVHPTFLYEFIANLIIFVILLQVRKRSKRPYTTMATYFLFYGSVRFLVEGLRTDPLYIAGTDFRVSQVLSAVMVAGSLIFLLASGFIKQRHPEREVTVAIPVVEEDEIDSVVTSSESANGFEEAIDNTDDSPAAKTGSEETEKIEETDGTGVAEKANPESALTGMAAAVETAENDQTDEDDN
jgi:phosphatidylglycerol:prolipoprotein diacylglycerol transferase